MDPSAARSMKSAPRPFLWLVIGCVLLLFSNGRWIVPAATWLFPIFILRFTRARRGFWPLLIALIATAGVFCVMWRGMISLPGAFYYFVAGGIGCVLFVPFLIDRIVAPRLRGFAATFVFPLTYTSLEYIGFQFTPYGTWGSLAYTQYGDLPLMQLAGITGIYGITFLITWFAAVATWAWEQNFDWATIRKGVRIYALVLAVVLSFGGLSLVFFSPASNTVKVAGIQSHLAAEVMEPVLEKFRRAEFTEANWSVYFSNTNLIIEDLFAKSEAAAKGGAKILSWAENPVMIPQEDEPAFVERGKRLAEKEGIYLALNYSINLSRDPSRAPKEKLWAAKVVIVGPAGDVLSTYGKTILVPGFETTYAVASHDDAVVVNTPYGRISSLICFDNDFPAFVRKQVGRKGVDILLDPSSDWKGIDPYHTQMTAFRAIENGFSVVRITDSGLSAAYDPQGRTLAAMDFFRTEDKVFAAHVFDKGRTTLYSRIGDLFSWLAIASLVALIGRAVSAKTPGPSRKRERQG